MPKELIEYTFAVTIRQQPQSTNFGSRQEWAEALKDVFDGSIILADVVSVKPMRNTKK